MQTIIVFHECRLSAHIVALSILQYAGTQHIEIVLVERHTWPSHELWCATDLHFQATTLSHTRFVNDILQLWGATIHVSHVRENTVTIVPFLNPDLPVSSQLRRKVVSCDCSHPAVAAIYHLPKLIAIVRRYILSMGRVHFATYADYQSLGDFYERSGATIFEFHSRRETMGELEVSLVYDTEYTRRPRRPQRVWWMGETSSSVMIFCQEFKRFVFQGSGHSDLLSAYNDANKTMEILLSKPKLWP